MICFLRCAIRNVALFKEKRAIRKQLLLLIDFNVLQSYFQKLNKGLKLCQLLLLLFFLSQLHFNTSAVCDTSLYLPKNPYSVIYRDLSLLRTSNNELVWVSTIRPIVWKWLPWRAYSTNPQEANIQVLWNLPVAWYFLCGLEFKWLQSVGKAFQSAFTAEEYR